jgi:hypothetical protein
LLLAAIDRQLYGGKGLVSHRHGSGGHFLIEPVKDGASVETGAADLEQLGQLPHPEVTRAALVVPLEVWTWMIVVGHKGSRLP